VILPKSKRIDILLASIREANNRVLEWQQLRIDLEKQLDQEISNYPHYRDSISGPDLSIGERIGQGYYLSCGGPCRDDSLCDADDQYECGLRAGGSL
jgi:hypothetical protein